MIRKSIFAVATAAAIGAAALIPTEASAGGGGRGGGGMGGGYHGGHHGHWGYGDGFPASARCTSATNRRRRVSVHAMQEPRFRVTKSGLCRFGSERKMGEAVMKRCVQSYGKAGTRCPIT